MLINVFRQNQCLTRVRVFMIFYDGDERNNRNDKETEKSPMRTIARGLKKHCHSCHWGKKSGKSVREGNGDGLRMGQTQAHLILTTSLGD